MEINIQQLTEELTEFLAEDATTLLDKMDAADLELQELINDVKSLEMSESRSVLRLDKKDRPNYIGGKRRKFNTELEVILNDDTIEKRPCSTSLKDIIWIAEDTFKDPDVKHFYIRDLDKGNILFDSKDGIQKLYDFQKEMKYGPRYYLHRSDYDSAMMWSNDKEELEKEAKNYNKGDVKFTVKDHYKEIGV